MEQKKIDQEFNKLVTIYNNFTNQKNKTKELEFSFKEIYYNDFKKIFDHFKEKEREEIILTSVSVLCATDGTRKEIFFTDGKKTSEILTKKERLLNPIVCNSTGLSYKVHLKSEEKLQKELKFDDNAQIKIKIRSSFHLQLENKWRIDMTLIKELDGKTAKNSLKTLIGQYFTKKITNDNFLDLTDFLYDVEVELLDNDIKIDSIYNVIKYMQSVVDENYDNKLLHNQVLNELKKLIGITKRNTNSLTMSSIFPGVHNLEYSEYKEKYYPPIGYYVMNKIDGLRTIIYFVNGKCSVVTADKVFKYEVKDRLSSNSTADVTILDCELVITHEGTEKIYVFDICYIAGEDLRDEPFEVRITRIDEGIEIIKTITELSNIEKQYMVLISGEDLKEKILEVKDRKVDFEKDGLILVQPGKPYVGTINLKWKPLESNTIDVLAKKAPRELFGRDPFINREGFTMYFLFVSIYRDVFYKNKLTQCPGYDKIFTKQVRTHTKIPFTLSFPSYPLSYIYYHPNTKEDVDGKIIEVVAENYEKKYFEWKILKIRNDKMVEKDYFGNSYLTSLHIMNNYINPFKLEYLWGEGNNYFAVEKTKNYEAQTAMISFVKELRINTLMKFANCVIDIGAGKGQDLFRYIKAGISHLIMIDKDKSALTELIKRRFNMNAKSQSVDFKNLNTTLHVMNADINEPFMTNIEKMERFGMGKIEANVLVCNLAFHYFCENMANIRNFISLSKNLLVVGGHVVLTVLMGDVVFSELKKNNVQEGDTYDIMEGEEPIKKYSIKRLYSSNTLEVCNQKIGVLLPFSNGEYYEEYLVNVKSLIREFKDNGFKLVENSSISTKLQEFNLNGKRFSNKLTESDIKWISLYGELVFKLGTS